MNKKLHRVIGCVAAAAVLVSLPAMPALAAKPQAASFSAVELEPVRTKEVTYFKPGTTTPAIQWVTGATALTFLPTTVTGDVTSAVKDAEGVYWIGTENGLQRVNFEEEDERDIVQYFAGPRYMFDGDDHVTALASDGQGGVWVQNARGITHIAMPYKTLNEKAAAYEDIIQAVHDRRGMTSDAGFTFTPTDPARGINYGDGTFTSHAGTSDNDGLWTAMYAIGEIYRYRTLLEQGGSQAEVAAAKDAALRATKAVLLLDYVSGRGNGFPARSYMLTSEAEARTSDGTDFGYQSQNGFWFHPVMDGSPNPNGIIPTMERLDENGNPIEPIGYSIVRVTKDAMTKIGGKLFPSGGDGEMNYNGLTLTADAVTKLNDSRPSGAQLGTDVYVKVNGSVQQVLPVVTSATNTKVKPSADTGTSATNPPLFQLTVPVYEQIPTFFNDLFPASAIKNGNIDMSQIVYKADTSSDEVIGHYALFFAANELLVGKSSDPEMLELKEIVEQATERMTDLILKDDHFYIEDATGKSTLWSKWFAKYFNDTTGAMEQRPEWASHVGVDADGEDSLSYGYEDAPLNALEVMSILKTASNIVGKQEYKDAYELLFDTSGYSKEEPYINGKGYIDMANEYIDRRLVRQATNAYGINNNQLVTRDNYAAAYAEAGDDIEDRSNINATLHDDWTQYINYSDEELAWFALYPLILQEKDPAKRQPIVTAFDQWYANEVREENPYYTFLYQLAHPERKDIDLQSAVRYLYRQYEYQIEFPMQTNRQDVLYIEPGDRDDYKQTNYVLPPDERRAMKNNGNPFETENSTTGVYPGYDYNSGSFVVGFTFTLPYWMGRYHGIIKE
ncbi:hypothetical protein IF188_06760 [Microbacterium sp. NEAU-LLC]|uniref:Uncharacterized protein n=1 Tax=Microbacterium helvum TaxID=2773713 RepID=A0ABR8NL57_9MICO|nr:hypothetical protein [Microbacterium helvum]MBD3941397.1 hypothetical protein [Microbacterium helvum]